jgi:hypothetical protein
MMEGMWRKENDTGKQPPSWALYAEAADSFRSSAEAFMEHVHLLIEARDAYQQAMSASSELRNRLDAGDQTLRSVMTQLEQVVTDHLSESVPDKKRPELVKVEPTRGKNEGTGAGMMFP